MRKMMPLVVFCLAVSGGALPLYAESTPTTNAVIVPPLILAQDRTAYFVGEKILIQVAAPAKGGDVRVELVRNGGRWEAYRGKPGPIVLDTTRLAPGVYTFSVEGAEPVPGKLYLVPVQRRSAASMQDEAHPGSEPRFSSAANKDPAIREAELAAYQDQIADRIQQTGMTGMMGMMSAGAKRNPILDAAARTGTLSFNNPDTRPTSFCPVANNPVELDGMTQRMLLTAQANGRYPNFGGFCFGYDTGAFTPGNRRMLLTYWQWNRNADPLRHYIEWNDTLMTDEFKRRTGYEWVKPEEYIAYTLAIKRPDMAPAIDLPTQRWLDQAALAMKPMSAAEQATFEKRLDAWSGYLMSLYGESYGFFTRNIRSFDPTLRYTSSVQIDHAPVIYGQYLPAAYAPLDFRYQSTWNDQVGAPDYAYQWLFTAGMLDAERPDNQPVWISSAHGLAHGRSPFAGKFTRIAAHILPHGASGIGNAFEAFSTLLGGMAETMQIPATMLDANAGRDFMDRFAGLALAGRGDYGVGILFSKAQFSRQYICQAFGTPQFRAFVSLTRMGYMPVYLTDDEVAAKRFRGVKSLVVVGQTVPLPGAVMEGMKAFVAGGGLIVRDGSTQVELPPATSMDLVLPLRNSPGRPHNWDSPVDDPTFLFAEQHKQLAPALEKALAGRGHAFLTTGHDAETELTLEQVAGGADATYVIAVNDTHVKSQADWRVLREPVRPVTDSLKGFLYDLTDERAMGPVAPFDCELSNTTARVYGLLSRELKSVDLRCRQAVTAGDMLAASVGFVAADGKPLAAMLPFHLAVLQPDGTPFFSGYRFTSREGSFAMDWRLPANAPAGKWQVQVRSQLNGHLVTVPVTLKPTTMSAPARALADGVVVREKALIGSILVPKAKVLLPLFPAQTNLMGIAESIRTSLRARGVTVEIMASPTMTNYTIGYQITNAVELEANALVEAGKVIGRVVKRTEHGNDWFGDYRHRTAKPVILLDIADKRDNEMVEAFADTGALWPEAGSGLAVVQGLAWAFGPRNSAVVISATDEAGLKAAADRLTTLPDDFLTASVRDARAALFSELHIGGVPPQPAVTDLTANTLVVAVRPEPFRISFEGTPKPYPADRDPEPRVVSNKVVSLPAMARPADVRAKVRSGEGYVSAFVFGMERDLRFSDALSLEVDVAKAGPCEIGFDGVFRYSDRAPCTAPQWENILAIRAKYLKPERRPPTVAVLVDGKPATTLVKSATAEKEVQFELYAPKGGKPKSEVEEVVTSLSGTVALPAGRHNLMFMPSDIVDGTLSWIRLGVTQAEADAVEAARLAAVEAEKQRQADEKKAAEAEKKRLQDEQKRATKGLKK